DRSAVRNPADIAASTTNTATTRAMLKIASRFARQRTPRFLTLYERGRAISDGAQRVGDPRAVGAQGREEPREQAEEQSQADPERGHRGAEPQVREAGHRVAHERHLG